MPQITNIVNKLVPHIKADTLLDVGTGDGETLLSMLGFFGQPFVYACDPVEPAPKCLTNYEWEKAPYHESKWYSTPVDIITFFDSLPCYNKDIGGKILDNAVQNSKKMTLVWCPNGFYPYPPFHSCWHPEDFLERGFSVYLAKNIHQGPPMVADGILAWRT